MTAAGRVRTVGRMRNPFSGRQLTTIIVAIVLVVGLPVGAHAVAGSSVFVADSTSGNKAKVDGNGSLQTKVSGGVIANRAPLNQLVYGVTQPTNFVATALLIA